MDTYIGSILLVAFNFVPTGFAFCDGSLLQINQNQALFALLGNQFGGDGKTTFALPKMAAPGTGLHYVICVNGIFPSRS